MAAGIVYNTILLDRLRFHNNVPSTHLRQALHALLNAMTNMAGGDLTGRWGFGLQTGLGKTTCTIAWLTALCRLGLAGRVTVAVASMEVEALCDMWDKLNALGVDMAQVGLLHSKTTARYQQTPCATDRPILLLCHARVRARFLEQFKCHGITRDLLIYDESLIATHAATCASNTLTAIAFATAGLCQRNEAYQGRNGEISTWLTEVESAVATKLKELTAMNATQGVWRMPQRSQETLDKFAETEAAQNSETVQNLIRMAPHPVKISNFADKGLLTFQVSIPTELQNIIILDASQPIRDLVRFDETVKDAEQHLPALRTLGIPLSGLKRYDGTTIHRMHARGGKTAMRESFKAAYNKQGRISQEVVEVLRHIPNDQTTLLIAFKPIYDKTGPMNCVKALEEAITTATIATMKSQESVELVDVVGDGGKVEKKPKISITTWGLHKGTNLYTHCSNVILVGIVHRDLMDLFGNLLGQLGDLDSEPTRQRLMDLQLSEVAHDCFQAIGRSRCRTVVDGVALPVNVWLIHYSKNLEKKLEPVLQGVTWRTWETKYVEVSKDKEPGIIQVAALAVSRYLDGCYERGTLGVSSRAVRVNVVECKKLTPRTFAHAVTKGIEINRTWMRSGQQIVHAYSALFPD